MNRIISTPYACLLASLALLGPSAIAQRYPGPLSPEESLKKIQIANGFKVELFASEPHVFDPVALEFDEQGNAYVVEMYDYPYEVEPGKGRGRIRILKDTNGDGRVDQSIIYAENVTEATSILPWKGGLIVTAAPNILYMKDTNGDGKADVREVLFSGFFQNNSEAQITSLKLGIDNWIYANNRGQSGMVTYSKSPGTPPVSVRGADFRFRLDRDQFELETGPGQFGQTINDWGHRFFTENSIHLQQAVIPWRYTHRHPFLGITKFNVDISDHQEIMFQKTEPPYWRAERTRQRNEQYKEAGLNRIEYARDRFTGASGGTIYNGDGLPKEFYGNIFTTDVSGNLVHRDILSPNEKSPVMRASRGEQEKEKEFMFSTDTWFRPITFTVAPDGYLYVLDYYRQHIETPVSIPDELKADMDFMAGSDKGRIYRVMPIDAKVKNPKVDLRNASAAQLVDLLSHANAWWRMQAQRLLVERGDQSVAPLLKALVMKGQDSRARLHAIYILEGLNLLNADIVKQALQDTEAGVRENGLMLAEKFPEMQALIAQKVDDSSLRVALQAVLSTGEFDNKAAALTLAQAINKYGQDQWFRAAVLSSNVGTSPALLSSLKLNTSFFQGDGAWKSTFIEDMSGIVGSRNKKEQVKEYLEILSEASFAKSNWQLSAIKGLKKGLTKAAGQNEQLKTSLGAIKAETNADTVESLNKLKKLFN